MPDSTKPIINYTMYIVAKQHYLKHLLDAGKITSKQFNQMDMYLYNRLKISGINDESIQTDGIPSIQISPQLNNQSSGSYVSLTDLVHKCCSDSPGYVIQSWMRSQNTIDFLNLWEEENNPAYSSQGYQDLIINLKKGSSTLTPKQWISQTNAIGIVSKQGKNGGSYALPVIACEFMTWLSPKFKLLLLEMSQSPNIPPRGI